MVHRGPDASGVCLESSHWLGHRRLKIVDLDDRSNQPFRSRDGRYVVIFNGEIYNFRELAAKHGLELRTTGDTEVLIELYARIGRDVLGEINGMFAFVILDLKTGGVFAARDRLGIKPLYLWRRNGELVVSSEMASLLELVPQPNWDFEGLRQYAKLRAFFQGRTAYSGVEMLEAGHFYENGKVSRYWELPGGYQEPPEDEELRDLVVGAIERRCLSDVEVGSYLSGGLDSTIVAGLAEKPHTWTVGFDGYNEFSWAQIAAKRFGSKHHEVLIRQEEFLALGREMVKKRREPLSVPNEILLYKMTVAVKEHNTVVLSGEGADELFFGYDRIFRWANSQATWDLQAFTDLYSYGRHDDSEIVDAIISPFLAEGSSVLDTVARFFQTEHLHGLLRRVDNSTMLPSVEARVPFVDHTLVERMAGVSYAYRCEGGVVKAPLKRIFADMLPREVVERPKIGFPVPLEEIFFGGTSELKGPNRTALDRWLRFNLEALTGGDVVVEDLVASH